MCPYFQLQCSMSSSTRACIVVANSCLCNRDNGSLSRLLGYSRSRLVHKLQSFGSKCFHSRNPCLARKGCHRTQSEDMDRDGCLDGCEAHMEAKMFTQGAWGDCQECWHR